MKKALLIVSLLVSYLGLGQCPSDDYYITTQAEIDSFAINFPNCTHLTESLIVRGNSIVNLIGLSQIEDVAGGLMIENTNIENLMGLESIQNLSSTLGITGNFILTDFQGLDNLETIAGQFAVILNSQLMNFQGLGSLTSIGNGSNLGMLIAYNHNLIDFEGVQNLSEIHGSLGVDWNDSLKNFNGLQNLELVNGWIRILDNDMLVTLDGLDNLSYCNDYLSISKNDKLASISALANLDSSDVMGVIIDNNSLLPYCAVAPVCDAIFNPNINVTIANNFSGCTSVPEVEAQCELSVDETDFSEKLSLFPNPVSSILNIEIPTPISFQKARIYSTLGQLILETSEKTINLETLSADIYLLEVITNRGSVIKKIVKQ